MPSFKAAQRSAVCELIPIGPGLETALVILTSHDTDAIPLTSDKEVDVCAKPEMKGLQHSCDLG